jgi:hypothetical protein
MAKKPTAKRFLSPRGEGFSCYAAYVAWYRQAFDGTSRMWSESAWRELTKPLYDGPGSKV